MNERIKAGTVIVGKLLGNPKERYLEHPTDEFDNYDEEGAFVAFLILADNSEGHELVEFLCSLNDEGDLCVHCAGEFEKRTFGFSANGFTVGRFVEMASDESESDDHSEGTNFEWLHRSHPFESALPDDLFYQLIGFLITDYESSIRQSERSLAHLVDLDKVRRMVVPQVDITDPALLRYRDFYVSSTLESIDDDRRELNRLRQIEKSPQGIWKTIEDVPEQRTFRTSTRRF